MQLPTKLQKKLKRKINNSSILEMNDESSVSSAEFNKRRNHLISKIKDIMNKSITLSKSEETEEIIKTE